MEWWEIGILGVKHGNDILFSSLHPTIEIKISFRQTQYSRFEAETYASKKFIYSQ